MFFFLTRCSQNSLAACFTRLAFFGALALLFGVHPSFIQPIPPSLRPAAVRSSPCEHSTRFVRGSAQSCVHLVAHSASQVAAPCCTPVRKTKYPKKIPRSRARNRFPCGAQFWHIQPLTSSCSDTHAPTHALQGAASGWGCRPSDQPQLH